MTNKDPYAIVVKMDTNYVLYGVVFAKPMGIYERCLSHCSFKKLVLAVIVLAILIRIVLAPLFTYDFDIQHWGTIIQNYQSGNNLYEISGYYYTPVWGYILAAIWSLSDLFGMVGTIGVRFVELLPIELMDFNYHTATTTTIGFNIVMKGAFIICDFVVAAMIYWFAGEFTEDKKKKLIAVILWLFCPIVIYMSSVQAMFDVYTAFFLLLSVILFYKGHNFLGGAVFALAFLLKIFPIACGIVLIAYVYCKYRENNMGYQKVAVALSGFLIMFAICMLPVIMNGHIENALSFVIGRAQAESTWTDIFFGSFLYLFAVIGVLSASIAMILTKRGDDVDRRMIIFATIAMLSVLFVSLTPQYCIHAIPLVIIAYVMTDYKIALPLVIMGSFVTIEAFALNSLSVLNASSVYMGICTPEWIISAMTRIEELMLTDIFSISFCYLYGVMILVIVLIIGKDGIIRKFPVTGKYLNWLARCKE